MGLRNEEAAYGIAGAAKEPSVTHRVVTRILACNRWNDGFGEVVSDGLIGEGVPIIPAKAPGPLTEFASRIFRLGSTGECPRKNKRGIVKAVLRGEPKLILDGQGRKLCVGTNVAIAWDNPKDALGLLDFRITLHRRPGRRSGLCGLCLCRGFLLFCSRLARMTCHL